jgi:Cu/Ag efflux protein CusF
MKTYTRALILATALAVPAAFADDTHHKPAASTSAETAAWTEGEVRRVDKDAKKITIKHGPLPHLEMPAMTMVFQVRDAALLDQVKPGDKVRFQAEKEGGAYVVTRIQP